MDLAREVAPLAERHLDVNVLVLLPGAVVGDDVLVLRQAGNCTQLVEAAAGNTTHVTTCKKAFWHRSSVLKSSTAFVCVLGNQSEANCQRLACPCEPLRRIS